MKIARKNQDSKLAIKYGFNNKLSKLHNLFFKMDYQKFGPFIITKKINDVASEFKFPNAMKIHNLFHTSL
jgi:hypothetical protein